MREFTNFESLFAQSIGLAEPWYIERAGFSAEDRTVHIYVGAHLVARRCGGFSVLCALSSPVGEVRRGEMGAKAARSKRFGKKLSMISETKMDDKQRGKVSGLSRRYPKTDSAFRMLKNKDKLYNDEQKWDYTP